MSSVGIFTRNHDRYLFRALRPGRSAVFRSQVRWAGARRLLDEHGAVHVYVCPIPGDGRIAYAGILEDAVLDPTEADLAALLAKPDVVDPARGEGLWGGDCKTLYVVSLRELAVPFPITELTKLSDGQPLSADYGYSYSLVEGHEAAAGAVR